MTTDAPLRHPWRRRAPELALEVALIVFAVFLALAMDQCNENRMRARLARDARQKVIEELERNRAEVTVTLAQHEDLLARVAAAAADGTDSLAVSFEFAEVSEAAWQTAIATQAVLWMDFEWVSTAARAYDLQRLFVERQRAVVDRLAGGGDDAPLPRILQGQLRVLLDLERGLAEKYDEVLR